MSDWPELPVPRCAVRHLGGRQDDPGPFQ